MSDAIESTPEHLSPNQRALRRFKRNRPAAISIVFLGLLFALMIFWPLITSYSYSEVSDRQFQPPDGKHWFGTDVHGRDLMTRVFYGARVSLLVGLVGAFVAFVIGVTWGSIAGYVGGRWDNIMMRIVDVLYSLPSILFVIVLVATFNDHLRSTLTKHFGTTAGIYAPMLFLFFGLGAVSWLTMARIVRGQVLSLRN